MSSYNIRRANTVIFLEVVSILVLVDVELQQIALDQGLANDRPGFNPCFSGCRVTTVTGSSSDIDVIYGVSILVLVDVELQRGSAKAFPVYGNPVSILVLVDVELQLRRVGYSVFTQAVSILVLVDVELQH